MFRSRVACLPFWRLPAPLFFLASPLLSWALGEPFGRGWWCWPSLSARDAAAGRDFGL